MKHVLLSLALLCYLTPPLVINCANSQQNDDGQQFSPEMCVPANESSDGIYLYRCSMDSMIHVREEIIGKANESCVRDNTCLTGRANTDTGLTVNCNGVHTQCTETVANLNDRCDSPRLSVRVWYECIRGSFDLCSQTDEDMTGSVYLHSPGFPDAVGVSAMCSCTITGLGMRVELLELYSRHVLNISADGFQVWPAPGKLPNQYNTPVINNSADSLVLMYAGVSHNVKQNAWIKITGNGGSTVRVKCSGNNTEITKSPASTSTTSTSTSSTSSPLVISSSSSVSSTGSTEAGNTEDTPTDVTENVQEPLPTKANADNDSSTVTVAAVCGVIIFLLVVVIVLVLLYFKIVKPSRNSHNDNMDNVNAIAHYEVPPPVYEEVQETPRDRNNTYNVLDLDDKTAHDYGKLHVYGNTGYKADPSHDDIDKQTNDYINIEKQETNCV